MSSRRRSEKTVFLERCEREVKQLFAVSFRDEVRITCERFNISLAELVIILSCYTTFDRLRLAIPLLATRNPGRKFTHKELGTVVNTSRERITKSLFRLREDGHYAGEITNSGKGGV